MSNNTYRDRQVEKLQAVLDSGADCKIKMKLAFRLPQSATTVSQETPATRERTAFDALKEFGDIPRDTVRISYHDEIVSEWKRLNGLLQVEIRDMKATIRDMKATNPSPNLLSDQRSEISRLREKNGVMLNDDMVMRAELEATQGRNKTQAETIDNLTVENEGHQGQINRLREGETELVTELKSLRKANRTSSNTHIEKLKKLNWTVKCLEDKVAGYELGMSKEQVTKECKDANLTSKGTKRKVRRILTNEEVWNIRRWVKQGRSDIWIERVKGYRSQTVNKIRHGKSFKDVPAEKPTTVVAGKGVVTNEK